MLYAHVSWGLASMPQPGQEFELFMNYAFFGN